MNALHELPLPVIFGAIATLSCATGFALGVFILNSQRKLLVAQQNDAVRVEREKTIRQLSHDLRSPLTALEIVLGTARGLSDQDRLLIGTSATRLRDMANTLAPKSTVETPGSAGEPLQLEVEFAVSQLRQQLRVENEKRIELRMDKESFSTAFTNEPRAKLRSTLAYHVDHVTCDSHDTQTLLVRCSGPNVEVRNTHVEATQRFKPQAVPTASWFVGALSWPKNGTVVITDDDEAVHAAWHTRLNALPSHEASRLLHLKTLSDLAAHVNGLSRQEATRHVYWVDCEFTGCEQTGLDTIGQLGIGSRSILCTSHYDDNDLRIRCEKLGTKLLPKTLLHSIPLAPRTDETVVLIDDDTLIHQVWQLAARRKCVGLRTFSHPEEFLRDMDSYERSTPVYIDSQLGPGLRGEHVARTVSARGFERIYITTGSDPDEFPHMPWVLEIIGKEPPF